MGASGSTKHPETNRKIIHSFMLTVHSGRLPPCSECTKKKPIYYCDECEKTFVPNAKKATLLITSLPMGQSIDLQKANSLEYLTIY